MADLSAPDQGFELVFLVEALHLPRWVAQVIPETVPIAVGEEDQRPLAVALLQAVGIELGLALALHRIAAGALGLHQRERFAVIPPEHVIHIAGAGGIGHALHLVLVGAAVAMHPTGFLEVVIDVAAGVDLQESGVRLGGGLVGPAQGGDLLAQAIQFLLGSDDCQTLIPQLGIALLQLLGQGLQVLPALGLLGSGGIPAGQEIGIEAAAPHTLLIAAVGECKPAQHLEQLPGSQDGVAGADWIAAMHGLVAEILEQPEAAHLLAGQVAENSGIHQIRQRLGGAWPLQLRVVLVNPLH